MARGSQWPADLRPRSTYCTAATYAATGGIGQAVEGEESRRGRGRASVGLVCVRLEDGDSAVWCYQRGACHTTAATTRACYCCATTMTNNAHAVHTWGAPHTPGPRHEAPAKPFRGLDVRCIYLRQRCFGRRAGIFISELRAPTTPDPHDKPSSALLARAWAAPRPAPVCGWAPWLLSHQQTG